VQSFLSKNSLLEFLQINVFLNCSFTYYVVSSLVRQYSNVLLHVYI